MSNSDEIQEPVIELKPSLGAALPPQHVIGRDELVHRYWTKLKEGNSLLLVAPRRVGKTSICTKLSSLASDGYVVSTSDVESCKSGQAFVDMTARHAHVALERRKAYLIEDLGWLAARSIKKVNLGVVSLDIDAQTSLEDALRRMLESLEASCKKLSAFLVLLWDEMPWFLDGLIKNKMYDDAIAILDGLRAHRQQHPDGRLRMIYTGSIGFFEVLDRLRERTEYGGKPTNDMSRENVPLLDTKGARELVGALLWGVGRPTLREKRFVHDVAARCEGHPFIIQWVTSELSLIDNKQPIGDDEVKRIFKDLVEGDFDPLDLEHYVQRLAEYGWGDDARAILDIMAPRGEHGATMDEIDNLLPDLEKNRIADVVQRLRRDGYVTNVDGTLRFCVLLLARWWTHRHGLKSP